MHASDKVRLGDRYVCFQCGTKFYDLNREPPTCPECDADQDDAPVRDMKALLGKGRKRPTPQPEEEEELTPKSTDEKSAKDNDGFDDAEEEEEEED